MIPVTPQPESAGFDAAVRRPGRAFIAGNPNPTAKEFSRNNFWKGSAQDLYAAYSGICAYSCFYMPPPGSTDHFLPKSTHPHEAYEWSNFRLCSHRLNVSKGDSAQIIDPFVIQPGWFVLNFPSCLVKAGDGLSAILTGQVETTISVLRLNLDDYLVQERCNLMMDYAAGNVTLPFLHRRYPFLALEIERQGLQDTVSTIFKTRG